MAQQAVSIMAFSTGMQLSLGLVDVEANWGQLRTVAPARWRRGIPPLTRWVRSSDKPERVEWTERKV